MPSKDFKLGDDLIVTVSKRRGNRYLRLSITPAGRARISIPIWAPYQAGLDFAKARENWIRDQRVTAKPLRSGQAIGKAHHLHFVAKTALTCANGRLAGTTITISHPSTDAFDHPAVQEVAQTACVRALRRQAEQLLPGRLSGLAETHRFTYTSVRVKHLKSRWGSCDEQGRIVLNLFLMQLPWEIIDYVLLHELTHTRIMRHGPDFWEAMAEILPSTPSLKKKLRNYHPVLLSE